MSSLTKLLDFMLVMDYKEFKLMADDPGINADAKTVAALLNRCCFARSTRAIHLAFERLEGEQPTPIRFETPKFYTRYHNAAPPNQIAAFSSSLVVPTPSEEDDDPVITSEIAGSLRVTLDALRRLPKSDVDAILTYRKAVDKKLPKTDLVVQRASVRKVIAANLLVISHSGNTNAIEEVFLQIEGQLEKVIKVLGGHDVYVDDYATLEAPMNAQLVDGLWVAENEAVTNMWVARLAPEANPIINKSLSSRWDEVEKEKRNNA
jgi:hypothetical protein